MGITSIDLGYTDVNETNAGHSVFQSSTVTFADGSVHDIDDVYFENDPRASVALLPDGFEYHEDAFKLPALFGYGHIASTWVALSQDADLRADAAALVAQASSGDIRGFLANFETFLFEWAGVADVDPDSRGDHIDARHLTFLEKAYGEPYFSAFASSPNPQRLAGDALTEQFEELMEKFAGRFLAQTAFSDGLLNATTQAEFDTITGDHMLAGLLDLAANYGPVSRGLEGDLQPAFGSVMDAVKSGAMSHQDAVRLEKPLGLRTKGRLSEKPERN